MDGLRKAEWCRHCGVVWVPRFARDPKRCKNGCANWKRRPAPAQQKAARARWKKERMGCDE